MNIDINAFIETLPIMGFGMLGIFIVIAIIMLCVWALDKLFPTKDAKKENE